MNYNETKRVLENVYKCKQKNGRICIIKMLKTLDTTIKIILKLES